MSVAIIPSNPYFPYTDKGQPVYNGALFIGQPGLNPKEFPQQVFAIDSQGVSVSLPFGVNIPCINTGAGGVPLYQGQPVRLVTSGDYSILLEDKKGAQIYYSQTETGSYQGDGQSVINDFESISGASLAEFNNNSTKALGDFAVDSANAIANSGYNFDLGEFTSGKTVTAANQALHHNDIYYITTAALPYTTTGATPDADPATWKAISLQPLQQVARSLNVGDSEVMQDTDTVTPIVYYIYSSSQQKAYKAPQEAAGKLISTVVGDVLTTSDSSTYKLLAIDPESKDKVFNYATITGMTSSLALFAGAAVNIKEASTGAGGTWDIVLSSTVTENGFDVIQCSGVPTLSAVKRIDGTLSVNSKASGSILVTVGSSGNFTSWGDALSYLSGHATFGNVAGEMRLLSGYAIGEGLDLTGGDYSWIKITSEDAVVYLSATYDNDIEHELIKGTNCRMPQLGCLVDMADKGGDGYAVRDGSTGFVHEDCGAINAGKRGLYLNGGYAFTNKANFSGANSRGVWATRASVVHAEGINISNCCKTSAEVSALTARRSSVVHAQNANISNSGTGAVSCIRSSLVNIENANLDGCLNGDGITASNGGSVNARFCSIVGSSGNGVVANDASRISLLQATVTDSALGNVVASYASEISARLATIARAGVDNIKCTNASTITITGSTIEAATAVNVLINDGGKVDGGGATIINGLGIGVRCIASEFNATSSTLINGNASTGLLSENGSDCRVSNATIRNNGGIGPDLRVQKGSKISANGVTTTNGVGSPAIGDVNGVSAFNELGTNGYITA